MEAMFSDSRTNESHNAFKSWDFGSRDYGAINQNTLGSLECTTSYTTMDIHAIGDFRGPKILM